MQPTHSIMMSLRMCSGTSPCTTTSARPRPPASAHPERLPRHPVLVRPKGDHAVGNRSSTELSGSGMFSISPFRNSTFSMPAFARFSRATPASHRWCRSIRFCRRLPNPARGQRRVDTAARPQIEHGTLLSLSWASAADCRSPVTPAPLFCRYLLRLAGIVKAHGDGIAAPVECRGAPPPRELPLACTPAMRPVRISLSPLP